MGKVMDYYNKKELKDHIQIHPINLVEGMLKDKESMKKIHNEYNCINVVYKGCDLGKNITLFPDGRISACCIGRFLDKNTFENAIFHKENPLILGNVLEDNIEDIFNTKYDKVNTTMTDSIIPKKTKESMKNKKAVFTTWGDTLKESNKICFLLLTKEEVLTKNDVEREYLNTIIKGINL